MQTADIMTTLEYFTANFDLGRNAIYIARCGDGHRVFAKLDNLPRSFEVDCEVHGYHPWAKISLVPELAYMHEDDPKKKTRKGRMLVDLSAWDTYRNIAPEVQGQGLEVVRYHPDVQAATSEREQDEASYDDNGQEEAIEVIPRPDLAGRTSGVEVARTGLPWVQLPGQPLHVDGLGPVLLHDDGSYMALEKNERKRVAGLIHLIRGACTRYAPYIAHDVPYLVVAYHSRDTASFYAALAVALPKYFIDLPKWLGTRITPAGITFLQGALAHPVMRHAIEQVGSYMTPAITRSLSNSGRITPPIDVYRLALEQADWASRR